MAVVLKVWGTPPQEISRKNNDKQLTVCSANANKAVVQQLKEDYCYTFFKAMGEIDNDDIDRKG